MKKALLTLFLILPLSLAAQNFIIIPAGQDTLYRIDITTWAGYDPIEIQNGDFILPAKVLPELTRFAVKLRAAPRTRGNKIMKTELAKLLVQPKRNIVFREAELQGAERQNF